MRGMFDRKRDVWYVAVNVTGDKHFREGAKCIVVLSNRDNACEQMEVRGLSRGGRKITKWVSWKKISNVRPVFYSKSDPNNYNCYADKADAEKYADGIRKCHVFLKKEQADKDARKAAKNKVS